VNSDLSVCPECGDKNFLTIHDYDQKVVFECTACGESLELWIGEIADEFHDLRAELVKSAAANAALQAECDRLREVERLAKEMVQRCKEHSDMMIPVGELVMEFHEEPFNAPSSTTYASLATAFEAYRDAKKAFEAALAQESVATSAPAEVKPRRTIVCLCGSTRFREAFLAANYRESRDGKIVLTVGCFTHSPEQAEGETLGFTEEQKCRADVLHFDKIELADEVLILNVGGYIGESTRRELNHAIAQGKRVRFLEEQQPVATERKEGEA